MLYLGIAIGELHYLKSIMQNRDIDTIPLQYQRHFGSGINRRQINFVTARDSSLPAAGPIDQHSPTADRYLSIVFRESEATKGDQDSDTKEPAQTPDHLPPALRNVSELVYATLPCEICNSTFPELSTIHEASIVHHVCIDHSYHPSSIDRKRRGLKYLSQYGWDPDQRLGLGTNGDGIREPIMPSKKCNTAALAATKESGNIRRSSDAKMHRSVTMDAGRVRKSESVLKGKEEKLRELFLSNEDVLAYLHEQH